MDIRLIDKNTNKIMCGGNQAGFRTKRLQRSGCGVIAATNLVCILMQEHDKTQKGTEIPPDEHILEIDHERYERIRDELAKHIPVLPYLGVNGLTLALGTQIYCVRHGIPVFVHWKMTRRNLLEKIEKMLNQGIPVILSVGPNSIGPLPLRSDKHRLPLYRKSADGRFVEDTVTSSHYVTVLDVEGEYLVISTWGRKCYIRWTEYYNYVHEYSNFVFSNVLCCDRIVTNKD